MNKLFTGMFGGWSSVVLLELDDERISVVIKYNPVNKFYPKEDNHCMWYSSPWSMDRFTGDIRGYTGLIYEPWEAVLNPS